VHADDTRRAAGRLGVDGHHVGAGVIGQDQGGVEEAVEAPVVDEPLVAQRQLVRLVQELAGAEPGAGRSAHHHRLLAGQQLDGVEDLAVARAPAQVGAEVAGGLGSGERLTLAVEQGLGAHQDAGGAEAALERPGGGEGVGQPSPVLLGEALEGGDRAALRPGERHLAAHHRLAVEQHRAAPALARRRAPVLGREHVELFAQCRQEMGVRPLDGDVVAVHRQFHVGTRAPRWWGVLGGSIVGERSMAKSGLSERAPAERFSTGATTPSPVVAATERTTGRGDRTRTIGSIVPAVQPPVNDWGRLVSRRSHPETCLVQA
jgi:hypothetical protein